MAVIKVNEAVKEVKWNKKVARRLSKRSHVPPSPAELNVYSPLQSPESYDNYGHPTPYGTGSTTKLSSDGSSAATSSAATGAASSGSAA